MKIQPLIIPKPKMGDWYETHFEYWNEPSTLWGENISCYIFTINPGSVDNNDYFEVLKIWWEYYVREYNFKIKK